MIGIDCNVAFCDFAVHQAESRVVMIGNFELPADLQVILNETGQATGEKLIAATRVATAESMTTLEEYGLEFVEPGEGMSEPVWIDLRDRAAAELVASDYIPGPLFDKTRRLLEQYRSGQAQQTAP